MQIDYALVVEDNSLYSPVEKDVSSMGADKRMLHPKILSFQLNFAKVISTLSTHRTLLFNPATLAKYGGTFSTWRYHHSSGVNLADLDVAKMLSPTNTP